MSDKLVGKSVVAGTEERGQLHHIVLAVSGGKLITLCSDNGEICAIDPSEGPLQFRNAAHNAAESELVKELTAIVGSTGEIGTSVETYGLVGATRALAAAIKEARAATDKRRAAPRIVIMDGRHQDGFTLDGKRYVQQRNLEVEEIVCLDGHWHDCNGYPVTSASGLSQHWVLRNSGGAGAVDHSPRASGGGFTIGTGGGGGGGVGGGGPIKWIDFKVNPQAQNAAGLPHAQVVTATLGAQAKFRDADEYGRPLKLTDDEAKALRLPDAGERLGTGQPVKATPLAWYRRSNQIGRSAASYTPDFVNPEFGVFEQAMAVIADHQGALDRLNATVADLAKRADRSPNFDAMAAETTKALGDAAAMVPLVSGQGYWRDRAIKIVNDAQDHLARIDQAKRDTTYDMANRTELLVHEVKSLLEGWNEAQQRQRERAAAEKAKASE